MSMQLSIWNIQITDADGQIVSQQRNQNTVHLDGEKYILSTAFATGLEGFGVAPATLYVGLDTRPTIFTRDALLDAAGAEVKAPSYRRMPISTQNDFLPILEDPKEPVDVFGENQRKVFTLRAAATFEAIGEDYGTVKNMFLTTAEKGTTGVLILSSPLIHPFDFWEGYKLTTKPIISLRAALIH